MQQESIEQLVDVQIEIKNVHKDIADSLKSIAHSRKVDTKGENLMRLYTVYKEMGNTNEAMAIAEQLKALQTKDEEEEKEVGAAV
jgi:hypothetical protein